jgi:hypothetical protein
VVVVGEGALDESAAAYVAARLAAGTSVLVLAQEPSAAHYFPVPVSIASVTTEWGSSEFHFTNDSGALPSLPRRAVLAAEDSTIQATTLVTSIAGAPFPTEPVVVGYKPPPGGGAGTVVGSQDMGPGRLVFCQYRLTERAVGGDPAAQALLADLLTWTVHPSAPLRKTAVAMPDGRALTFYDAPDSAARS